MMASPTDSDVPITAAILAGGLGMRLRSIVSDRPKVLAEVGGRPFVEYLLAGLDAAGIRHTVVCSGHMAQQIEETFGGRFGGVAIEYSQETEPLGTGGALRLALSRLHGRTVLVMNGDSYCHVELRSFVEFHHACRARASIAAVKVSDTARFGRLLIDDKGCVTQFEEKAEAGGPGRINAGVYLIEREAIEEIPSGRIVSIERDIFPQWIGRGLYACAAAGPFIDIGTPESYSLAETFFAGRKWGQWANGSCSSERSGPAEAGG